MSTCPLDSPSQVSPVLEQNSLLWSPLRRNRGVKPGGTVYRGRERVKGETGVG